MKLEEILKTSTKDVIIADDGIAVKPITSNGMYIFGGLSSSLFSTCSSVSSAIFYLIDSKRIIYEKGRYRIFTLDRRVKEIIDEDGVLNFVRENKNNLGIEIENESKEEDTAIRLLRILKEKGWKYKFDKRYGGYLVYKEDIGRLTKIKGSIFKAGGSLKRHLYIGAGSFVTYMKTLFGKLYKGIKKHFSFFLSSVVSGVLSYYYYDNTLKMAGPYVSDEFYNFLYTYTAVTGTFWFVVTYLACKGIKKVFK